MQTNLRGRDFIGDLDFSKEEVETILDVAWDLKRKRALGEPHAYLRDKTLAMLFFFTSTRTRGSFESGMAQLGGGNFIQRPPSARAARGLDIRTKGIIGGNLFSGEYKLLPAPSVLHRKEAIFAAVSPDVPDSAVVQT